MTKFNSLFATKKRIALFTVCTLIMIALLGMGTLSVSAAIVEKKSIGIGNAINLVLSDLNLPEEGTDVTKAKLTLTDGAFVYEIVLNSGGMKYEYKVNAYDGTILKTSKNQVTGNTNTTNTNNTTNTTPTNQKYIGVDAAKSIALKNENMTSSNVIFTKAKLALDDGIYIYDIEYISNSSEYEYEINAVNGDILARNMETIKNRTDIATTPSTNAGTGTSNITLESAKSIAVKNAGTTTDKVSFVKARLDYDDGVRIYDVEFVTNNKKYEYEIYASNGKIKEKSVETVTSGNTNTGNTNTGSTNTGNTGNTTNTNYIGIDSAKSVALKHAGVSASNAIFTKAKLERDDGVYIYDIEFRYNGVDYEYEIHATSGKIIDFDKDWDD